MAGSEHDSDRERDGALVTGGLVVTVLIDGPKPRSVGLWVYAAPDDPRLAAPGALRDARRKTMPTPAPSPSPSPPSRRSRRVPVRRPPPACSSALPDLPDGSLFALDHETEASSASLRTERRRRVRIGGRRRRPIRLLSGHTWRPVRVDRDRGRRKSRSAMAAITGCSFSAPIEPSCAPYAPGMTVASSTRAASPSIRRVASTSWTRAGRTSPCSIARAPSSRPSASEEPVPGNCCAGHARSWRPDGTVYVANYANRRVEVFDAEGRYLRRYGNDPAARDQRGRGELGRRRQR